MSCPKLVTRFGSSYENYMAIIYKSALYFGYLFTGSDNIDYIKMSHDQQQSNSKTWKYWWVFQYTNKIHVDSVMVHI